MCWQILKNLFLEKKFGFIFSKGFVCFVNDGFEKTFDFETCRVEDYGFENDIGFGFGDDFISWFADLSGLT